MKLNPYNDSSHGNGHHSNKYKVVLINLSFVENVPCTRPTLENPQTGNTGIVHLDDDTARSESADRRLLYNSANKRYKHKSPAFNKVFKP